MSQISPLARILLTGAAVVGLLAYLAIVELGANAGLVHRGVTVGHLDVGGLSQVEAAAAIEQAGTEMRESPIRLHIENVGLMLVYPRDLGWKPHGAQKAAEAMAIGREGGILEAASQRLSAWFGGRHVSWDQPRTRPLRRGIREVVRTARAAGVEVAWDPIRDVLISATFDWPRRDSYAVPARSP